MDINIAGQRKSILIDKGASYLFISEKVVGIAQAVELQISLWKGMKDFEDMRGGTKVLSAIQLAEDVHCGKNINLIDWSAIEAPLERLEVRQTDVKPIESSMGLSVIREMGCASNFRRKVVMQTGQLIGVHATSKVHLKHLSNVGFA
ncbi:hypothetical protein J1N35_004577 [Gossypium stocksii]|uniref:Uncharacterized protein n=1 Tax=Gossypium stocksii TaxID=47602 RepID=A0A9D3WD23_9ROSI|nr:hypothetical protein J1N35_004577 [Gossypium stocksii]